MSKKNQHMLTQERENLIVAHITDVFNTAKQIHCYSVFRAEEALADLSYSLCDGLQSLFVSSSAYCKQIDNESSLISFAIKGMKKTYALSISALNKDFQLSIETN